MNRTIRTLLVTTAAATTAAAAGIYAAYKNFLVLKTDRVVKLHIYGFRELQFYLRSVDFRLNNTCHCFEGHFLFRDAIQIGKTCSASSAVSTHLGLRAVGVEKSPTEIMFR